MYEDSVLKETWQVKDQIAAQYGYDVRALARALQEQQKKSGRKIVSFPPKRVVPR